MHLAELAKARPPALLPEAVLQQTVVPFRPPRVAARLARLLAAQGALKLAANLLAIEGGAGCLGGEAFSSPSLYLGLTMLDVFRHGRTARWRTPSSEQVSPVLVYISFILSACRFFASFCLSY